MGFLDGDIASSIYAGFKGRLLSGVIRKRAEPVSSGLDPRGDPIDYGTPTDHTMEGFTEDYSDDFRATAGIPATDFKVNVFGQSLPGIRLGKDDIGYFTRGSAVEWFQLRNARKDPAGALWTCQAFSIPEPEA